MIQGQRPDVNPESLRAPFLSLEGEPQRHGRGCDHPGCAAAGTHRAPKSPDKLDEHFWFCLEHVRAYNARWDYFKGKSRQDINDFHRASACWERPTWEMGSGRRAPGASGGRRIHISDPFDLLRERFGAEFTAAEETRRFHPGGGPMKPEDRRALDALGLEADATKDDIKKAYKTLVKQYHPDVAGDDRKTAERFRIIADAYRHLAASWRESV